MFGRIASSAGLAAFMTLGLLSVMSYLVSMDDKGAGKRIQITLPELPKVLKERPTEIKDPRPERFERTEIAPTKVIDHLVEPVEGSLQVQFTRPESGGDGAISIEWGPLDGDPVPITTVQPVYPHSAISRELEGFVVVEFTVTAKGTCEDAHVVESTHRVFERPALQAAEKCRYKPRFVNGVAKATTGIKNRFSFQLED